MIKPSDARALRTRSSSVRTPLGLLVAVAALLLWLGSVGTSLAGVATGDDSDVGWTAPSTTLAGTATGDETDVGWTIPSTTLAGTATGDETDVGWTIPSTTLAGTATGDETDVG